MSDLTYTVPPKPADPKPRYVPVTDQWEVLAMMSGGLNSPIGQCINGQWYATEHSLRQFRGLPVEFDV